MGRVLDETPLSHYHPKIYNYFPSPPKPRAGWGMHSHPNFETTIKIPSPPCLDPGMFFLRNEIENQRIKILDIQKKKIYLSLTKKKPRLGIKEHHGSTKETQSKQTNIREKYLKSKTQKAKTNEQRIIPVRGCEKICFEGKKWQWCELMRLPIDLIM